MEFPTRYDAHLRPEDFGTYASEASATKQEFKDECDINSIMRRYISQGVLPTNVKVGRYGDFTGVGDYRECLETLEVARSQFMSLSSDIRKRFGNDPAAFLAFVSDKANLEEARKLGLLREEAQPPPVAPAKPELAVPSAATK
ncbi:MAG: internal scaffolding protein [Microviridae sp.]|nr:MAG: internal scaffolding protein [Microviridae sp.]